MNVLVPVKRTGKLWARRAILLVTALTLSAGVMTATTSWASGESVGSEAQAVADEAYSYPLQFDATLTQSLATLSGNPANAPVAQSFYDSYVAATKEYGTALLSAAQNYSDTYTSDPAGAKNTYIDAYNRAGDTYFNRLENARNTLISELGGKDDVARNMFVNEYNSARDLYRGQLESIKNKLNDL